MRASIGGDGRRPTDEDWLDPNQGGPPLAALLQERRGFFLRPLALALAIVVLLIGLGRTSNSRTPSDRFPVGPPPDDRQLLWFALSTEADPFAVRVQAFDWSGHRLGALTLPCQGPCSFAASPDGQRLLVYEQLPKDQPPVAGIVYDVNGRRLGTLANPSAIWADDSRHLCQLSGSDHPARPESSSGRAYLLIADPYQGQARFVASVARLSASSDPAYWELLACSITADRAVVAISDQGGLHDLRVVQLSTGRTVYTRDDLPPGARCGCAVASLVVAADAAMAVENLVTGNVQLRKFSTGFAASWPSGSVMPGPILGLSWQGRRALTAAGIIDLSTGRILWRAPSPFSASLIARRPGSDDLLVSLSWPSGIVAREVIVQGDGRQIPLAVNQTSS